MSSAPNCGARSSAGQTFDPVAMAQALPASLLAQPRPLDRRPRIVASQSYSPTIEQSFSGSTSYFALAGIDAGLLEGAMGFVHPHARREVTARLRGAVWKAGLALRGRRTAGFKFARPWLDLAWRRVMPALRGVDVISNFQMVSPVFLAQRRSLDAGLHFYIDGTLHEYFEGYSRFEASSVDPRTVAEAIDIERRGYLDADSVITMSEASRETLIGRYGVDSARVAVVLPGANILDRDIPAKVLPPPPDTFILSFVGLYPERKGLPRLLRAVGLLRAGGRQVKVRVIGSAGNDVIAHEAVDFLGRIDKRSDAARFVAAIANAHLGCLLSDAELCGIGLIESLRVGVPVLGSGVGGMKDVLEAFGGVVAPPSLDDAGLAALIAGYVDQPARYAALRESAAAQREKASWTRAAREIDGFLNALAPRSPAARRP